MAKDALIVKTTPLPQSRISFELEIPSETCKTCVNETISSISRSAKIPGFRLGKIPKQVLIQRIGISQLHASALEKIIDKSWQEALKIKSIEPLSEPDCFAKSSLSSGNSFSLRSLRFTSKIASLPLESS